MNRMYNRKKRIIITYATRIVAFLLLVGVITLMVCGGIYIYELFHKGDEEQIVSAYNEEPDEEADGTKEETPKTPDPEKDEDAANTMADISGAEVESTTDEGLRIVLDAGHGGNDGGTFSGDIVEKDITLAVVLNMKELLEEQGVEVVLTRETDDFMYLEERTAVENAADADLFISIHCNYYDDDAAVRGLECYYYEESEEGQEIAEAMIESLKECDEIHVRSAKEDSFYVTKYSKSPAVLIELGFLSNEEECRKLSSEEYQETLAEELVESLEEFIASRLFNISQTFL